MGSVQDWVFAGKCTPALRSRLESDIDGLVGACKCMDDALSCLHTTSDDAQRAENILRNESYAIHIKYTSAPKHLFAHLFGLWTPREEGQQDEQRQRQLQDNINTVSSGRLQFSNISGSVQLEREKVVCARNSSAALLKLVGRSEDDMNSESPRQQDPMNSCDTVDTAKFGDAFLEVIWCMLEKEEESKEFHDRYYHHRAYLERQLPTFPLFGFENTLLYVVMAPKVPPVRKPIGGLIPLAW
ncbi:MAG: hypothetical protein LQ337_003346 [Flavoplaca oasis]|nr:MAG: hypothetical protein LQ337_003346 [Flavoplaca oasis]